jgi:hypothetical protein
MKTNLKEEIKEVFGKLNEEANTKWDDTKILELLKLDTGDEEIFISFSIGKWDMTTFHDVIISLPSGEWNITQQSKHNRLTDVIVGEFILPTIFG